MSSKRVDDNVPVDCPQSIQQLTSSDTKLVKPGNISDDTARSMRNPHCIELTSGQTTIQYTVGDEREHIMIDHPTVVCSQSAPRHSHPDSVRSMLKAIRNCPDNEPLFDTNVYYQKITRHAEQTVKHTGSNVINGQIVTNHPDKQLTVTDWFEEANSINKPKNAVVAGLYGFGLRKAAYHDIGTDVETLHQAVSNYAYGNIQHTWESCMEGIKNKLNEHWDQKAKEHPGALIAFVLANHQDTLTTLKGMGDKYATQLYLAVINTLGKNGTDYNDDIPDPDLLKPIIDAILSGETPPAYINSSLCRQTILLTALFSSRPDLLEWVYDDDQALNTYSNLHSTIRPYARKNILRLDKKYDIFDANAEAILGASAL